MRKPPRRPDGKEWTKSQQLGARLMVRGKDLFEVAEELDIKPSTVRDWRKLDGWETLLEWTRAALTREEMEQLGVKSISLLDRLMLLADASYATRRFLDDALLNEQIEPGEYALRMAQVLKTEREALRDHMTLSGFAELRAQAARKLAVMPSSDAAPENLAQGEAPALLTPEEERERALKIAQVLAELGGKVEVG